MSDFTLEVATPERELIKVQVAEAQIPAADGYIGVLPEHSPLLSELGTGELSYVHEGETRRSLFVSGGWVEVLPHHVRVLADVAERADEIDVGRAKEALKRSLDSVNKPLDTLEMAHALNAMKRAQARLKTKGLGE
jgi:F-type H+-transporting ATPase subunit epsilon